MRLLKPVWVAQEGHPIFSVDVHPDGSRFATGGQGGDSGRVTIWNMGPVLDESKAKSDKVPKLLSQMDQHLACVNCVRWSGSGHLLASCGDDKLVMIWQKSSYGGGAIFGGGGKVSVETWRCTKTLRSHNGDVLDLSWSPADDLLATASVDNTVIVWNALNLPEIVRVLKGHTGLVKGVSFDPVGKFLASQSDDKTLRIWRVSDWAEESCVSSPFEECGATTHVLRPDWSPAGDFITSAHAMNGGGPTAQIIERKGWKCNRDFVGHKKAISCVRFCAKILEKPPAAAPDGDAPPESNAAKKKSAEFFACVALGSRDRSFSVWCIGALTRPYFVVHDVFDQSVLDLSWSRCGSILMACSMDGSVAACVLDRKEAGAPIADHKFAEMMVKTYGQSFGQAVPKKSNSTLIIENPEILKFKDGADPAAASSLTNGVAASVTKTKLYPKGPTDKQIEARTSDGRRRITPIFIPPPSATSNGGVVSAAAQAFGTGEFGSVSTQEKSQITVEKREGVVTPNISPNKLAEPSGGSNSTTNSQLSSSSSSGSSSCSSEGGGGGDAAKQNSATETKRPTPAASPPVNVIAVRRRPKQIVSDDEDSPATPTTPPAAVIEVKRKPGVPAADSASEGDGAAATTMAAAAAPTNAQYKSTSSKPQPPPAATAAAATTNVNGDASGSERERKLKSVVPGGGKASTKPDLVRALKRKAEEEADVMCGGGGGGRGSSGSGSPQRVPPAQAKRGRHNKREQPHQAMVAAVSAQLLPAAAASAVVSASSSSQQPSSAADDAVAAVNAAADALELAPTVLQPIGSKKSQVFSFRLEGSGGGGVARSLSVSVTNSCATVGSAGATVSHVRCREADRGGRAEAEARSSGGGGSGGGTEWETLMSSPVCAVCHGGRTLVVGCDDGSLHLLAPDDGGRRLAPPIMLPSQIAKVCVRECRLAVLTTTAKLFLWSLGASSSRARRRDRRPPRVILRNECVLPLLRPARSHAPPPPNTFTKLTFARSAAASAASCGSPAASALSSTAAAADEDEAAAEGLQPVLVTSAGRAFVFSADLGVWLKLADRCDAVHAASSYTSAVAVAAAGASDGGDDPHEQRRRPLAAIEKLAPAPAKSSVASVSASVRRLADIAHCEGRAAAARHLQSSKEYRFWLLAIVRHAAEAGDTAKLRQTLDDLLGPARSSGASGGGGGHDADRAWAPTVVGLSKRDLLRDALKIVAGHLEMQRLFTEYQDQLNFVEVSSQDMDALFE